MITALDNRWDRDGHGLSVCAVPSLAESVSPLIYERGMRRVESNLGRYLVQFKTSALKSGPVSVLLPFLERQQTGPVPESFRMQELWTGTAKNRKKPVETGCNWSQNEYNKTRAISAKIGHRL